MAEQNQPAERIDPADVATVESQYADRFADGATGLWTLEAIDSLRVLSMIDDPSAQDLLRRHYAGALLEWMQRRGFEGTPDDAQRLLIKELEGTSLLAFFTDQSVESYGGYWEDRANSGDVVAQVILQALTEPQGGQQGGGLALTEDQLEELWLPADEVADFEKKYASRFREGAEGLWSYEAWEIYNQLGQVDNEQLRNALLVRHLQAAHEWARITGTTGDPDAVTNAMLKKFEGRLRSDWFSGGPMESWNFWWDRKEAEDQYAQVISQFLAI